MILWEANDWNECRRVFRTKTEAMKQARQWSGETGRDVEVQRLECPSPSVQLVIDILNEDGYVTEQATVATIKAKEAT